MKMGSSDINGTIAALATQTGESGINIVRLSGKESLEIAAKVFRPADACSVRQFKSHTIHYGWIIDPCETTKIIDEVLLTLMRAPRSYTREDVVEINCHGGIVAARAVLDLVLTEGARLAEPGEFTKRAFLNGRIDLTQAEAVLDIIRAKTDFALKVGTSQLKGVLSRKINKIRQTLIELLSRMEAAIDFPDEEISIPDLKNIKDETKRLDTQLVSLLEHFRQARFMREGLHIVICGRPNVGKSSLLNALLKQERSIVTSIPGTTRDTIEEIIDIRGIPVRIVDTAGIIEPKDLVEKKAIQRSKQQVALADLVILLFDGSKRLNKDDASLIRKLSKKNTIAVVNKIDLRQNLQKARLNRIFSHVIEISTKDARNINLLEEAIAGSVYQGKVLPQEALLISNLRHAEELKKAQKLVAEAANSLDNKLSLELIAQNVKDALMHLDRIMGKEFSEDLLDKIFSDFCIGK